MEEEVQQLKELVLQLQADNGRLRRECAASSDPGGSASGSTASGSGTPPLAPTVTERLVVIPRDRRCPMFNGRTGLGITEWVEEVEACMRARHLAAAEQALFIFDHLEGEAKEEIKFCSSADRRDPAKILAILNKLYECDQSYIALQQVFFSRRQLEGETLQEFSLALMSLMGRVRQQAPDGMPNADVLLRDQFIEHVLDCSLRRELKQLVRRDPTMVMMELRAEAMRWEREGLPGGVRGRSYSLPSALGLQCGVQGRVQSSPRVSPTEPTLGELMDLMKRQQEQLNQLTQTVASLRALPPPGLRSHAGPVICRRCQLPGHFARDCTGERVYRQGPDRSSGQQSDSIRQVPPNWQPEN